MANHAPLSFSLPRAIIYVFVFAPRGSLIARFHNISIKRSKREREFGVKGGKRKFIERLNDV